MSEPLCTCGHPREYHAIEGGCCAYVFAAGPRTPFSATVCQCPRYELQPEAA